MVHRQVKIALFSAVLYFCLVKASVLQVWNAVGKNLQKWHVGLDMQRV